MKPCHFCKKYIDEYANSTRLLDSGKMPNPHDGRVACGPCLGMDQLKNSTSITKYDFYVVGSHIANIVSQCLGLGSHGSSQAEDIMRAAYADELEKS